MPCVGCREMNCAMFRVSRLLRDTLRPFDMPLRASLPLLFMVASCAIMPQVSSRYIVGGESHTFLQSFWRDQYPERQTFTHAANLSSARLDRWLVSEQLQPWISTAPDALSQTAVGSIETVLCWYTSIGPCSVPRLTNHPASTVNMYTSQHDVCELSGQVLVARMLTLCAFHTRWA